MVVATSTCLYVGNPTDVRSAHRFTSASGHAGKLSATTDTTVTQLAALVEKALGATCGDRLPGRDQLRTNRFGVHLAWLWAIDDQKGRKSNIHVYAAEHAMPNGSHLQDLKPVVDAMHAQTHRREFLTDVFVERYDGKRRRAQPLLAAEIEASPNHGVEYAYEGEGRSDYLWDFTKLLYVRVPKRLFVACTLKGENLDVLSETLVCGYQDACLGKTDGDAAVVLLPAGHTERKEVRLGRVAGGRLAFRRLWP